jgi:hypothetical protein
MNRLPLVILAVLVLSSAGFGLLQLDKVQKLTESAAAWDSERAALQKRIWDLQKRNGELERRRSAVASRSTISSEDGPNGGEGLREAAGPTIRTRNEGGRFGAMLANPEMQKLMAMQQKSSLDGHYSSLFKQLQLSPADLEKFKDLLVQKQSTVMDVMAAARAEGLTGRESRDQIRDLMQNAQAEVDSSIRSTLGDAAYAQYQNYEATQPQRNLVSQLEQRLSYSPAPLTDSQSQQLVQILAETSLTKENSGRNGSGAAMMVALGGSPGGPAAFFGGPTITADAITRSQGVLSSQQVSALQTLQQEQQASAQLRQQMRANFPAGNASPATVVNQTVNPSSGTPGK